MNTSNAKAPRHLPTAPATSVWALAIKKRERALLLVVAKWQVDTLLSSSAATDQYVGDVINSLKHAHKAGMLTPAEQETARKAHQCLQKAAQEAAFAQKIYHEHPGLAELFQHIDVNSPNSVDDVMQLID